MSQSRILVIDDDRNFLRFTSEVLTGAGYDVRALEEPFSVIALAEDFQPHLILLDITIPGKDGFQLAQELSAGKTTADIPRLFITAKSASEGSVLAKNVGGVAYLEKPVKTSTLLWTIKTILEKK